MYASSLDFNRSLALWSRIQTTFDAAVVYIRGNCCSRDAELANGLSTWCGAFGMCHGPRGVRCIFVSPPKTRPQAARTTTTKPAKILSGRGRPPRPVLSWRRAPAVVALDGGGLWIDRAVVVRLTTTGAELQVPPHPTTPWAKAWGSLRFAVQRPPLIGAALVMAATSAPRSTSRAVRPEVRRSCRWSRPPFAAKLAPHLRAAPRTRPAAGEDAAQRNMTFGEWGCVDQHKRESERRDWRDQESSSARAAADMQSRGGAEQQVE